MKKVGLVFVLAVFAPSLVLAWLAARSVRDQQVVVAQQQTALYQAAADSVANDIRAFMVDRQHELAQVVETLRARHAAADLGNRFDELVTQTWPFAEVGFAVTLDGNVLCPSLFGRPDARSFRLNNDRFLCSREPAAVYWTGPKTKAGYATPEETAVEKSAYVKEPLKVEAGEAEFKQLVGDEYEGLVARFIQDELKLLAWYRNAREPEFIYGAQIKLSNVVSALKEVVGGAQATRADALFAVLNEDGRAVAGTQVPKARPLVVSEIGPALPHWKVAVSLKDPSLLTRNAQSLALMLGLMVALMLAAIVVGGALIVLDFNRQVRLARQKTDFVSNVSHELKTPLTSIRMFSELLSEDKVADDTQRKQFLHIISAEAARLTRLINNVLDFARMERGEKKYEFRTCDLNAVARDTVASYRPQLEANGFTVALSVPAEPTPVKGDCDALAQLLVNLLSNAEKYSGDGREVAVEVRRNGTARRAEVCVLDRGPGVPAGAEQKIFEQFYRAHDSLSSGIQGSGLGLTLVRQIARAHDGEARYKAREGGGSAFIVTLPLEGEA